MGSSIKKNFLIVMIIQIIAINLYAQNSSSVRNFRRNSAAVIFSSIGGAVLGLSTLSFYGSPQEHTNNITIGAAIGLAAGITYILMDPPAKTLPPNDYSELFNSYDNQNQKYSLNEKPPIGLIWRWEY